MLRREHNNQTVDAIGRKLVENDRLSVDEIDRIIGKPDLFDQVNRQIAAVAIIGAAGQERKVRSWIPAVAASFASLAVLAILATAVIDQIGVGTPKPAVTYMQVPDAAPDVARSEVPPKPVVAKLSADRARKSDSRAEKASFRPPAPRIPKVNNPVNVYGSEAEFYPVAYTGDPAETAGGGRIIRVDLNRASLFALGVNMPLENDVAMVKADLLIGADGVTRAIRLVE
ncbi:hypothetical protein BH20ACI2_BH20ACI2_07320 [soil metagenome]